MYSNCRQLKKRCTDDSLYWINQVALPLWQLWYDILSNRNKMQEPVFTADCFGINFTTMVNSSGHRNIATFEQKLAISVVIIVFGIWSTVANTITLLAIASRKYMHNSSNIFIFSLAVSDLISGLIASPLWLYKRTWGFDSWNKITPFCQVFWFVDESTSYCTALHIASFATWRYLMIKFPHRAPSIKKRHIIVLLFCLWIVSFIFGGVIFSSFYKVMEKPGYGISKSWPVCYVNMRKLCTFLIYYTFSSITFLIVPMVIVITMSILISKELYFSGQFKTEITKIKEKRAVFQLAMITFFFMVGYLPHTIYQMWTAREVDKPPEVDYWIGVATYLCLRFSECMNPIAYNVASTKMRKASREILVSLWYRMTKCKNVPNSDVSSSSPVQFDQNARS